MNFLFFCEFLVYGKSKVKEVGAYKDSKND
jgi:hypothetical protein